MGQEGSAGPDPCTTLPHFSPCCDASSSHPSIGELALQWGGMQGHGQNKIEFLALLGVVSLLGMMGVGQGYGWEWA